ncbi:hypothetical protein [Bartonella rattaustraliani]|uniref:hypothetical protein n=1 Tax=Bartonella rattaustraliani TaxID=481139 RepID=UPI000A02DF91|nr:hypothetical protein [Bartonella rattaustraliani]
MQKNLNIVIAFGFLCLLFIGSSAHRLIGSSAHRLIGSSAHRLIGSSAHRLIGSSAHRLIGSSAHRLIGSSAHKRVRNGFVIYCKGLIRAQKNERIFFAFNKF